MSQNGDDLVFDGANGLTGGAFVRSFRQRILSRGIQDDDRLIAVTAASYFEGTALGWYESLTEETQESWKLLRRAFLTRWPPDQQASGAPDETTFDIGVASTTAGPAPAAAPRTFIAPTPASSYGYKSVSGSSTSGIFRGRIRLKVHGDCALFGFVSHIADKDGDLGTTMNVRDALTVQMTPSHTPHGLKITSGGLTNEWLGLVLHEDDSEQELATGIVGATAFSMRLASDTDGYADVLSAISNHTGPNRATVWNLLVENSLMLTWKASNTVYHRFWPFVITDRQSPDYGGLMFFSGFDTSFESHPVVKHLHLKQAEMKLEPF